MNVIARVDQMLAGAALTEERFTKPVDVDNEKIVVNSLGTLNQRHRRKLCEEAARLEIERESERASDVNRKSGKQTHALAHEPLLTAVKERFGSIEDRLFKSGIGAGRRRFRQPRQRRTDRYGHREREASCASQPPRGR